MTNILVILHLFPSILLHSPSVSVHSLLFSYAIPSPPVALSHSVIPSHAVTRRHILSFPSHSIFRPFFHLYIIPSHPFIFPYWHPTVPSSDLNLYSGSILVSATTPIIPTPSCSSLLLFYYPFRSYCSVPYIFWQAVVVSLQLENQLVFNLIPSFRTHSIFPYLFHLSALLPSSTSLTLS